MIRIRYSESLDGTETFYNSTSVFKTVEGRDVTVTLLGNTGFVIQDVKTKETVAEGKSKKGSSTYLKRLAKNTLLSLMDESSFQKETRKKRNASA